MQCYLPEKLNLSGNLSENWRVFKQALEIYIVAAGLEEKDAKRKLAILLNLVGEEGLKIYNNFNLKEDENTYERVIKEFHNYCNPKRNLLYARFLFYERKQKPGEPFDSFYSDVKKLLRDCCFQSEEEALRDKLVLGTNDKKCQSSLLVEDEITLSDVVKKLRISEYDKEQIKNVQLAQDKNAQLDEGNSSVDAISKKGSDLGAQAGEMNKIILCKWCGLKHVARLDKCPARGKECSKCKNLNHFATVCRTKSKRAVKMVEKSNTSDEEEEFYCGLVSSTDWSQKLLIENTMFVNFKLDTGSEVNLIPYSVLETLSKSKKLELKKCRIKLFAYNKSHIRVHGSVLLEVKVKTKSCFIEFIVTESGFHPTLGKDTCELLGLIIRKQINEVDKENLLDEKDVITKKYIDVFTGSGKFPNEYEIQLKPDSVPISKPPHRVPLKLKQKLKTELNRLCELGVITKQDKATEWVNRIVIVEKDENSIRVCLDPKALNKCILKKYYQIPTINDLKAKICNAKYFSVLDLKESFWQIGLTEESRKLCTFSTIFGTYSFNVLPFGLDVSAEVFQENCEKHFNDIENLFIYIDDYLVYGKTKEEHDTALKKVLLRARELNIKFNIKKFQYLPPVVQYLGHEIVNGCLRPDTKKIETINNYDIPKDRQSLQRFLGMVNYLRDFIPNLSEITTPLRQLLKKNTVFLWNDNVHTKCVNQIKQIITSPPVLQNFDPSLPIVIQADSSQSAIGCVLLQNNHPIAFGSKSLTKSECEYGQIDKEFLAILFSCRKFHYYIYGRHVIVQTDHLPLVALMNKEIHDISSQRLRKIRLKLAIYDVELKYIKGSQMLIADAISRASSATATTEFEQSLDKVVHTVNVSDTYLKEIIIETQKDISLQNLVQFCKNGWPININKVPDCIKSYYKFRDMIYLENNVLYVNHKIIVPVTLRKKILQEIHSSHFGVKKTQSRANSLFYWPSLNQDILNLVLQCRLCEKYSVKKAKEPMIIDEPCKLPYEKIACDFLTFNGNNYLIVADYYSKWFDLVKVTSLSALTVKNILKNLFAIHGVPKIIRADNMPFNSWEFKEFSKLWGFEIVTSSPYYPKSNGFIERFVGIVKNMLKKSCESKIDFEYLLLEYRNTPVMASPYSPAQLLFSRMLRSKIPIHDDLLLPKVVENFCEYQMKKDSSNKKNYDKNSKVYDKQFYIDQSIVYLKNNVWLKGKVIGFHNSPRSLIIEDMQGNQFRRNTFHVKPSKSEIVTSGGSDLKHNNSRNCSDSKQNVNKKLVVRVGSDLDNRLSNINELVMLNKENDLVNKVDANNIVKEKELDASNSLNNNEGNYVRSEVNMDNVNQDCDNVNDNLLESNDGYVDKILDNNNHNIDVTDNDGNQNIDCNKRPTRTSRPPKYLNDYVLNSEGEDVV